MEKHVARPSNTPSLAAGRHAPVIEVLVRLLAEIRYGSIEITIHDATVVQIERKEKMRL